MNAQNNQRRGSEGDGGVEIRQPAPCGVEGTPDPARPNKQPPKGKWCPAQPCGEWRRAGGCGQRGYRRGEALVEGTGIGGGQCGDDPLRRERPHCRRERNGDPTSDRHHRPRHGRQLRPMRNGAKNSENTQWQDHSGCVAHPPNCWVCRPKASRRRTPRHEARGPHGNQKHDGGSHAVSHAAPAGPVAWEEP